MRIVFMGTPDFSVPSLEKLYTSSEIEIKLVITQPDKPRGRGQKLAATPIKKGLELGLETLETANVNQKDIVEKIRGLSPDIIVVVAFGQKLSQEILDIPPYGCVNLHASLLPEYREPVPFIEL